MNKWVKRTSILLVTVAVAGAATAMVGKLMGENKMTRQIAVAVAPVALTADAAHIEQGRYLFSTRGCAECHGASGGGKDVIKEGAMLVVSPNITAGANGVTANYRTEDWVRTLRHGVKPNGHPVMIM